MIKFDTRNYRKHNSKNKELIKKSLSECGAGRSILIDAEDVIVAGNGVYEQAKELKIPVKIIETNGSEIIAVKRTDLKQDDIKRKKLAVMDNSASDSSEFDFSLLIDDFSKTDLELMNIEVPILQDDTNEEYLTEEPDILAYNEDIYFPSKNPYDIPELREDKLYKGSIDDICYGVNDVLDADKTYLCLYASHNIVKTATNNIIGFYVDDERFNVVWNNAVEILNRFKEIRPKALMTPNFSIWADVPKPLQIMSWYKTMWCGRYWQEAGFDILPTLNWGGSKTYEFCFLGLPKNIPTVSIQARNIKTKQEKNNFINGLLEVRKKVNFKELICYGRIPQEFKKDLTDVKIKEIQSWQEKKQNDTNK